jgi:hypothetical protein
MQIILVARASVGSKAPSAAMTVAALRRIKAAAVAGGA